MKITARFIESKPRYLYWLYSLVFGICLLIVTPLVAMALISEICVWAGNAIVKFAVTSLI